MRGRPGCWGMARAIRVGGGCARGGASNGPVDSSIGADWSVDASWGDMCAADKDGVFDQTDQCPNTPMGEPVNTVGCADSQLTAMLETVFPPYNLTWTPGGDPGRAGGLTWTYVGIERGDLFHIWWIVCDDPAT